MRKMSGLVAQHMAGPLARPLSLGGFQLGGGNVHKRPGVSLAPANLNNAAETSTVFTPLLTITPASRKRGALHAVSWRQLDGPAGQVVQAGALSCSFRHALPTVGTYPIAWRGTLYNQFSEVTEFDVSFSLTRQTPTPALQAIAYPTEQTFAPIDPVTRKVTVNFSVFVTSGVPPYSYDWNGGDSPYTASNSATFDHPPGTQGWNFIASCWVTDGLGRRILVQTADFFIYEGPPF